MHYKGKKYKKRKNRLTRHKPAIRNRYGTVKVTGMQLSEDVKEVRAVTNVLMVEGAESRGRGSQP